MIREKLESIFAKPNSTFKLIPCYHDDYAILRMKFNGIENFKHYLERVIRDMKEKDQAVTIQQDEINAAAKNTSHFHVYQIYPWSDLISLYSDTVQTTTSNKLPKN